jgi:uncharacterized small protein (DUF1192 family)
MAAEQLPAIIDELYGLDPADFIPARAEHIKKAKKAGDKELATEIGKLRKPTLVAWAVNLAARELKAELTNLLTLGDALRDAQRHLSGPDLRKLTTQRQQVVGALAKKTADLAADHGHALNETAVREVNQTLHAALADPDIAEKAKTGTLVAAATYSGFGPAGLASVPEEKKDPDSKDDDEPQEKKDKAKKDKAQKELDEARKALDEQREVTDAAREKSTDARTKVSEIDDRIAELREELDRAEQERQFARSAEKSAAEARRKAERDLEEAERRVEDAEDALS